MDGVNDAPRCPYPTEIVTERIGRYTVTAELPSTPEGQAAMLAPAIPQIAELLRGYDRRMREQAQKESAA